MEIQELSELTEDLVRSQIGLVPAMRRFVRTLVAVRSLRIASFSLAESLDSGRQLLRSMRRQRP